MRTDLTALVLLVTGLVCVVFWAIFRVAVARRDYALRRRADAVKLHVIRGGEVPDGLPAALARGFSGLRWAAALADILLAAGIGALALAQLRIL